MLKDLRLRTSPLRRATAALLAAALVAPALAGGADDDPYYPIGTGPVTIKMRNKGKRVFFSGPKRVSRDSLLTVVNAARQRRVGAHTFSLV